MERPTEENMSLSSSPKKAINIDKIEINRSPDRLYKLASGAGKQKEYKPLKGRTEIAVFNSTPTNAGKLNETHTPLHNKNAYTYR